MNTYLVKRRQENGSVSVCDTVLDRSLLAPHKQQHFAHALLSDLHLERVCRDDCCVYVVSVFWSYVCLVVCMKIHSDRVSRDACAVCVVSVS